MSTSATEVLSWNQIVDEIAEALGATAPRVARLPTDFICQVAPQMTGTLKGDKAHPGIFDNSKIKKLVPGYTSRKHFRVGVRESVAWLRAHPEHQNLNASIAEVCEKVVAEWEKRPA